MKKIFLILLILLPSFSFAFEPVPTQTLLLAYLENDLELQNLTLAAQKAELALNYAEVSNGFDISLASGNVTLKADSEGTKITASPSVKMSLPQASNLSFTAETDLSLVSEQEASFSDTSLSLGVDIISSTALSRKVTLLKAQRTRTEALRSLQNRAVEAESAFYTELKTLLSSIKSIIKAEQTLYSDTIDFDSVKAQGYSSSSSTYRLAQMQVLSDKHSVESLLRALLHDYIVFYKKCGYDISLTADQDYLELIPDDFESAEPVNVLSFEKDSYTKIEAAVWTNQINSMERKTDSVFSLAANAGYTFANSSTDSDTVDAGLSAVLGGLSLSAGVALPVESDTSPALVLSASLSPFSFKKNAIEKKVAALSQEQELLDIESARSDYETYIVSAIQDLEEILWEKESAAENYEMYAKLADELEDWYKQGIITESEYLSARSNAAMYRVEVLINMLDVIIYNDEVKSNFVSDSVLMEEKA
ncbi:MAG: TolC family protein [Treponema sp.]|nr:TolC family protein [Treponema sp.]